MGIAYARDQGRGYPAERPKGPKGGSAEAALGGARVADDRGRNVAALG